MKKLILSITLLASFAGVRAMEGEENNQENAQQVFNMGIGLQVVQQYLIQQGMLPGDFVANPDNYTFGYDYSETTNLEGQSNTTVTVTFGPVFGELQTIDITAEWPQIQNLITNQNNNNNQE